jgi:hypothetical protein
MATGSRRGLYTSGINLAQYEQRRGFEGTRKYSVAGVFERFSLDARKEICKTPSTAKRRGHLGPRRRQAQCGRG